MFELLTLLCIIASIFFASKSKSEKTLVISKICLYILNFLIFYGTFTLQKIYLSKKETFLDSFNGWDRLSYILTVFSIYPFALIFLFGLSRIYKDYKHGEELSNFCYLTIAACVLSLIIPGTSYLILSAILIDLVILLTKKEAIRYIALILAWLFLIVINVKVAEYEKEQAIKNALQDPRVMMVEKIKNKIKESPNVGKYTFELINEDKKLKKRFSFSIKNDEITLKTFDAVFEKNLPNIYLNSRDINQGNLFAYYLNQNNDELIKTLDYIFKEETEKEIREDLSSLTETNDKISNTENIIKISPVIYRNNTLIIPIDYVFTSRTLTKKTILEDVNFTKQKEIIERINKLDSKTLKNFKKKNISVAFFNKAPLSREREIEILPDEKYEELTKDEYIAYYSATLEDGKITINE